jgi:hypothetical protein
MLYYNFFFGKLILRLVVLYLIVKNKIIKMKLLTDVNECTSRHGCGQICENTVGSYLCSCEEGFKLQLSDRKTCRRKFSF